MMHAPHEPCLGMSLVASPAVNFKLRIQVVVFINQFDYFFIGRETAMVLFAVNNSIVKRNIENSVTPLNQGRIKSKLPFYSIRQTGGLRQIISLDTVFDCDIHIHLLHKKRLL